MTLDPFTPYACSIGEVIEHQAEPPAYIVRTPDGRTVGIPASATPSPENVEADIANPPQPRATPADIKGEAQRRILIIAPIWRQMNMTARTLDLTNHHGADPAQWPAQARAERDSFEVIYARILAIRAYSDALELNPPALADLASAGWPE